MNAQATSSSRGAMSADTAGGWNADDYARNARFVADLAAPLVGWLDPKPGESIMDLGCGDGELTTVIARYGAELLGVDTSPELVAAARQRGLHAVIGDGQCLSRNPAVAGPFDAVFSNAALHWMNRDPQAVVDAVFERLRPGGRFVAEFGGAGNCAPIRDALRAEAAYRGYDPDALDPWFFPDEESYIRQLGSAGFSIEHHECVARPTRLPGDISDWLTTLARPFLQPFAQGQQRTGYINAVRQRLIESLCDTRGRWTVPYVRLRFIARRPIDNQS